MNTVKEVAIRAKSGQLKVKCCCSVIVESFQETRVEELLELSKLMEIFKQSPEGMSDVMHSVRDNGDVMIHTENTLKFAERQYLASRY